MSTLGGSAPDLYKSDKSKEKKVLKLEEEIFFFFFLEVYKQFADAVSPNMASPSTWAQVCACAHVCVCGAICQV